MMKRVQNSSGLDKRMAEAALSITSKAKRFTECEEMD